MKELQKIAVRSATHFELEQSEMRRLYLSMAMLQFPYLRVPDYRERILLEHLTAYFKRFLAELTQQTMSEPNNLTLNKLRLHFENHYKNLKSIIQSEE